MSKAMYLQRGETLDYKNDTNKTIEAGTVIPLVTRVGIAGTDIEPGALGSVHVVGIFEIAKTSQTEIPMGTALYFDGSGLTESENDGAESGAVKYIPAGYAAASSKASDAKILVKLQG